MAAGDAASRPRGAGTRLALGGRIVEEIDLEVRGGELLAVIGPNGAGKTSLFNLITGRPGRRRHASRCTAGRLTALPAHRRVRHGLGRTFQTSSVLPGLTVAENAQLAAQAAISGPYGSLTPWGRIGGTARSAAADALERTRLAADASRAAGVALARRQAQAGAGDPARRAGRPAAHAAAGQVLLLDEPMAGMAVEEVPELTALIREIHAAGATILMVEHHMEVVLDLAERIAVLHHGALLACDVPEAITANPVVREAYLGEPL